MKRFALALILAGCAGFSSAQSLSSYLQLRRQHGVVSASDADAVQSIVGNKVLELEGVVKGSFRVGSKTTLLFERATGGTQEVETDVVPDWMVGTEAPARLLVKVIHADPSAPARVLMLGAARDEEIRKVEAKTVAKKKPAAPKKAAAYASEGYRNSRAALYGPIGRGGSRAIRRNPGVVSVQEALPIYASFIKKVNPRLKNREAMTMAEALIRFSKYFDVDARLIVSIVYVESGFDPNSVSHAGAMGLGQLMPGTAQWMGVRNPFNSIDNLYGMVKLIRTHLDQYNQDIPLTLAAYNAGMGAVRRHGGIPPYPETQNYVRKVIYIFNQLRGAA